MRLFAAIDLSEPAIEALADWQAEALSLLPSAEWRGVLPHLWHLTLAFYGDVDGNDADDLAEALDACAGDCPQLSLAINGFGLFPKVARANVFWAGVEESAEGDRLRHLARCCRRAGHATVRARTAKERAFRAHITVARARGRVGALDAASLLVMPELPRQTWCAESFSLYQSILRPEGPQYRRLERFKLKAPRYIR